jgi:hypothetical protein
MKLTQGYGNRKGFLYCDRVAGAFAEDEISGPGYGMSFLRRVVRA